MHANESNDEKQPAKRSAFTIMNSVRDHCEQSDAKKILLFTLTTYCDGKGICWPGNEELVKVTRKGKSTVHRMLRQLQDDGELEVLASGAGRGQKRIIRLTRYVAKGLKAVSTKGVKAVKRLKVSRSGAKRAGTDNDNCQEHPSLSDNTSHRNSIPSASSNGKAESEKRFGKDYQNQNQPAQDHVKWPEFAEWCRSEGAKRGKGGQPTEAGFWKWLNGQKPQWRNKVRQDFDEEGYELNGKFYTRAAANELAAKDAKLLNESKFRKAGKRDRKIQILVENNGQ